MRSKSDFERYLKVTARRVDKALARCLPPPSRKPAELHRAMRFAVLSPGKRLRPILALAVGEALGSKDTSLMSLACVLEMVHSSSLIYDDLPEMDDAKLRRGKPCLHIKFSQATAILTANSLLVLAFEKLAEAGRKVSLPAKDIARAVEHLAVIVGSTGMSGGQMMDLQEKNGKGRRRREINLRKTARLFVSAVYIPAVFLRAGRKQEQALCEYARHFGLAFQMVDDLADRAEDGRSSSSASGVRELLVEAKKELAVFGERAGRLRELAGYLEGMIGGKMKPLT